MRSGETISHHFNMILLAIIRLHDELLKKPQLVPSDFTNQRWRWFEVHTSLELHTFNHPTLDLVSNHQLCVVELLMCIDRTYIKVNVPASDRARYRKRKGEVATNVLGVCDTKRDFIYVLAGWEGPTTDSRILRDAISRPNGLKVPKGNYR
ncbi:hypothetical protein IC582_001626 [Cucumis melo]